jgi:hypothetical protein
MHAHVVAVLTIACTVHDKARRLQTGGQPLGDLVIILDQQDANGATPGSTCPTRLARPPENSLNAENGRNRGRKPSGRRGLSGWFQVRVRLP